MSINTVKIAGKCLLVAVRDKLRAKLFAGDENACNIEADETAHPISGDTYVAVIPGGYRKGPAHDTCGGVNDVIFDIRILVVRRITAVPKDRTRDAFLLRSQSLQDVIGDITQEINWKYDVTNAAASMISEQSGGLYGNFHHPLVWEGEDAEASPVGSEMFGGKTEPRAGLKKSVRFGMARFTDLIRA